jgi:hypothetical protein
MRTTKVVLLAGLCSAIAAGAASAQTRPGFEVSAELLDYSYRERLDGDVAVRDDGGFVGIGGTYVETIGDGVLLRAHLNVALGSVDYRGPAGGIDGIATEESRIDDVSQGIGQLELHLGKDFALGGTTLTPFVGIGSRYLRDDSGGETTDDGLLGYDREVSFAYVPIGMSARLPLSPSHDAGLVLSGQYNIVTHGTAESKFSRLDPAIPDVEVDLEGGSGFELSALLSLPVGRPSVSFGPFVRRWSIDRSHSFVLVDPEGSGEAVEFFEPKNDTTEFGLRIAFGF